MKQAEQQEQLQMFENMINTHGTSLLRLCYLLLQDSSLAEDALQDTFLKAYLKFHTFRGESSEKTWLTQIAVNTCKGYRRSSWFRRVDLSKQINDIKDEGQADHLPDDTVTSAVKTLPIKYRTPILLYYYQNFSIDEIAKALSLPQNTIKTRLKRGRALLKPLLEQLYEQ